jgi:hypothetical protein
MGEPAFSRKNIFYTPENQAERNTQLAYLNAVLREQWKYGSNALVG